MRRLLIALLFVYPALAATTTVTGSYYTASGAAITGSIYCTFPRFVTAGSVVVGAGAVTIPVAAGAMSTALEPNDTSTPTGWFYSCRFSWMPGTIKAWRVPTSATAVNVTAIETDLPVSGSSTLPTVALTQLPPGGAVSGQVLKYNGYAWLPGTTLTDPTTTVGDLLVRSALGTLTRFAAPSDGSYCIQWTSGVPSWVACSGGGGGPSGITTLNSLTGATQTFTNDTNVTIVSGGTAHVITWSGALAKTRQHANTLYTDGTHLITGSLTPSGPGTITATTSAALTGYTIPGSGTALVTSTGSRTNGKCVEYDANGNIAVAASNAACGAGGTSSNAYYLVTRSTDAPTNAVNLGLGTTGIMYRTVGGGIATISTATSGTHFAPATSGTYPLKGDGSGGFAQMLAADVPDISATYMTRSLLTTKGDILGYSTLPVRLAACTNNQVLKYDSGQTAGVKCETPIESGTSLPVTCTQGAFYTKTDANPPLHECIATNTWRQTLTQGDTSKDGAAGFAPAGGTHAAWIVAPAADPSADWALALPAKPTANSLLMLPATTTRTSNDTGVPTATSEGSLLDLVTTVRASGATSDSAVATEKAVRTAIGSGTIANERWFPAGFCRGTGGTGDTLWAGSAQTLGWSFSSGLCGTSLATATTDWTAITFVLPTNWNSTYTFKVAQTLDPSQTGTYTLQYSVACYAWSDVTSIEAGTGISHGAQAEKASNMSSAGLVIVDELTQADITDSGCAAGKYLQLKIQRKNTGTAASYKAIIIGVMASIPYTL